MSEIEKYVREQISGCPECDIKNIVNRINLNGITTPKAADDYIDWSRVRHWDEPIGPFFKPIDYSKYAY